MNVLREVIHKRDKCLAWHQENPNYGYLPAIEFYNRIIDEMQSSDLLPVVVKLEIALKALRDIRDGKDNPCYLAEKAIKEVIFDGTFV